MKRIEVLDVWRSLAVLLMMAYHLLYDLYVFDVVERSAAFGFWPVMLRYAASASFIFISGAVVRFSRNPIRRGAIVFCCGMIISIVTNFMGSIVVFGVLHCLGVLMIAYGLIKNKVKLPKGIWFAILCLVLFAVCFHYRSEIKVDTKFLVPFGLTYEGFYSADYYPLLPWGLLFTFGIWFGDKLPALRERWSLLSRSFHPAWSFLGRHSLIIYLAHQPVFYGLCALIWGR